MLEFDTLGQPRLPKTTRVYDSEVTSTSAPTNLTLDTATSATYTVIDGSKGQGGINMALASTTTISTNATIKGHEVDLSGVAAIKVRCVFDAVRASAMSVQAIDDGNTRGFGLGKYDPNSAQHRFLARSAAGPLYVKNQIKPWVQSGNAGWTPPQKFDISVLLDVEGKALYAGEGNQWIDMWEGISAIDTEGVLVKPQFRVVSSIGATPGSAIFRRLTTTLYYR